MLSSPLLLSALLLAAILHELGHYWVLRRLHAQVTAIRITALGAEMQVAGRLSYGGALLAAAAGPAVNLALALLLGYGGRLWSPLYLFAGAQLVLGVFNLLPVLPLDGGSLLWEPCSMADGAIHRRPCCGSGGLRRGGTADIGGRRGADAGRQSLSAVGGGRTAVA